MSETQKKAIEQLNSTVSNLADEGAKVINKTAQTLNDTVSGAVNSLHVTVPINVSKLEEMANGNAFFNAKNFKKADVVVQNEEQDWRLKLSLPDSFRKQTQSDADLMAPLIKTNGLAFPYTPTVLVSQSANYQSIQPVHTNYPYYSYQNSQVDQMTITADFYVQNAAEARYWVACIHYLRSVTKMNYGVDGDAGQPPPVVRLNGYGDYVFNQVPVIVNSFQFDMPKDVDYISCALGTVAGPSGKDTESGPTGWAPSTSIVTVAVTPQYSRTKQSEFSLNNFVKGGYIKTGDGFI